MKAGLLLLPFVGGSFAANIPAFYGSENGPQVVLDGQTFDASPTVMEGFSLDLNEERLVQMEGKDPIRMTELEKVRLRLSVTLDSLGLPYIVVEIDRGESNGDQILRCVGTPA